MYMAGLSHALYRQYNYIDLVCVRFVNLLNVVILLTICYVMLRKREVCSILRTKDMT